MSVWNKSHTITVQYTNQIGKFVLLSGELHHVKQEDWNGKASRRMPTTHNKLGQRSCSLEVWTFHLGKNNEMNHNKWDVLNMIMIRLYRNTKQNIRSGEFIFEIWGRYHMYLHRYLPNTHFKEQTFSSTTLFANFLIWCINI